MGDLTESTTAGTVPTRQLPSREDCWTEEATWTLVDAWGRRYVDLNRGHLRQKDWQEVADAVNDGHGHDKKTRRTDVQCKNRIDTLKKKYKTEKTKIADSNGTLTSPWPFFSRLEFLIGSTLNKSNKLTASVSLLDPSQSTPPSPPMAVPLPYRHSSSTATVIVPQKRPSPSSNMDGSYFRRNYSAIAAAAAAAENEEDDEWEAIDSEDDGIGRLAKAIERFGEIYEKVENMKQKQIIELEKQKMQLAKDLEVKKMQFFMNSQFELAKNKRPRKPGSPDDICS